MATDLEVGSDREVAGDGSPHGDPADGSLVCGRRSGRAGDEIDGAVIPKQYRFWSVQRESADAWITRGGTN